MLFNQQIRWLSDTLILGYDGHRNLNRDQMVFLISESQVYGMINGRCPVGVRVCIFEMIVMDMGLFAQYTAVDDRLAVDCIDTGHIQCDRVKGGKHPYIWNDGHIIFCMAVAVRGNVDHKADVEMRAVF